MTDSNHSSGLNRRSFLKRAAGLGGAWVASGCASMPLLGGARSGGAATSPDNIGIQLYTVRDQLQKDFPGTIQRLAQLGYKRFEFAGYNGWTPEQVRLLLERLGATAPSSHIGANLLRDDLAGQIRAARVIGHEYITVPSIRPASNTADGWRQVAADFNGWAREINAAGLRFAYHNHNFEFQPLPSGERPYDILLGQTDPALVQFELDLYWTVHAGQNPLTLFQQHPGRFAMWHVKDMVNPQTTKDMAPVGKGTIDFRSIFDHAQQSGMRYFFVEHDSAATYPGGSLASAEASYQYLHQLLS